ncbi:MAG: ABC transporter permease [Chloroflexota bacterium]|nr:ABC transporter permease [Chloroflexota bacterium]
MRLIGRLLPNAMTIGLFVGVAGMLFLLARPHYLPSPGTFWNILGGEGGIFDATAPQDLAGRSDTSVLVLVLVAALHSALLAMLAIGVALGVGVPFGFYLAIHAPRRIGEGLRSVTNLGVALPAFFLAFLLQVAAVELSKSAGRPLVPTTGFGLDAHLVIPVLSLAAAPFAYVTRLVALGATDLNARDFVRTARAKGLSERAIIYQHIAPNMVGALSEAALGGLRLILGGLVIVEYLVVWPGLGSLLLRAMRVQDGMVLLLGVAILGTLFLLLEKGIDLATGRTGVVSG